MNNKKDYVILHLLQHSEPQIRLIKLINHETWGIGIKYQKSNIQHPISSIGQPATSIKPQKMSRNYFSIINQTLTFAVQFSYCSYNRLHLGETLSLSGYKLAGFEKQFVNTKKKVNG
jgi:hypothetical protein